MSEKYDSQQTRACLNVMRLVDDFGSRVLSAINVSEPVTLVECGTAFLKIYLQLDGDHVRRIVHKGKVRGSVLTSRQGRRIVDLYDLNAH